MTDFWRTQDGRQITHGLTVWDYNLDRVVVDVHGTTAMNELHECWDGWFEMRTLDGGRSSKMNGERMWVLHPTTGECA